MARTSRFLAGLALVLGLCAANAFAIDPPAPDGSLWNVVNNTSSGQRAIPVVYYDNATGILSVDTRGVNRTVDTVGNAGAIGADDVGLITLLVTGPAATSTFAPFAGGFDNGVAWTTQFFAGKMQTIGTAVFGQYLPPGVYPFHQYPVGTNLAGAPVEMAVNFAPNQPGGILRGVVQIPEPASFGLIGSVALGLVGLLRRR